ncbi:MAG: efflux transporter outer membrane subunit [Alphaproteobacteria bacterium]|jgi:NodT family efflux transporter outer membrane factor (OMF) lipoprotein|nr:efflux transporter outer membrane subunit [Alphaproteobacteria bacterium]MBP7729097.1 efflux transporter outer membrane subunit [Alphaproteobacteria bacterium]
MRPLKLSSIIFVWIFCLVGCTLGPDFETPAPPETKSYTESKLPEKTVETKGSGGQAQYFIEGKDLPACWWELFHSKSLNALIEKALKNSPTMQAAQAALLQAQANLQISTAAIYPTLNAQFSPERQRFNPAIFDFPVTPQTFNVFFATVNAAYTMDVFGAIRRQIEASEAQLDYQLFVTEATYLTLTSNIVTTTIMEASLRGQIHATKELISLQGNTLKIIRDKFRLGGTSNLDVLAQETQLAQTQATLPPLETALAKTRNALAILVGDLPSESEIPAFSLTELHLPTELPLSLPSCLAQQRPDIKAAEALLHSACAQVGVATANLFPQFTITGGYGGLADRIERIFDPRSIVWNLVGNVLQPIFQGGLLIEKRKAAIAGFEQALAQYKQTILQAFQNVADTLQALENDAKQLHIQTDAEQAAWQTLKLTKVQYKVGAVGYLNLLNAENQYQQARIGRIQAEATRYADTAALFQALGGGWWNRPPIVCSIATDTK